MSRIFLPDNSRNRTFCEISNPVAEEKSEMRVRSGGERVLGRHRKESKIPMCSLHTPLLQKATRITLLAGTRPDIALRSVYLFGGSKIPKQMQPRRILG